MYLTNSKRLLYNEVMVKTEAKATVMDCPTCQEPGKRFGRHRNGLQRYRCNHCRKTYTEEHKRPLGAMTVPMEKATLALQLLIEGTSVRSAERITGLHRDTILRLLLEAGRRCEKVMGRIIRNVPVKDVQCDEVWCFIRKKEAHKTPEEAATDNTIGDAYTFVAIERGTKLVLNFALGRRDQATTDIFVEGLRLATAPQRFQISTDGLRSYVAAIEDALEDRVDYGMLIKSYNEDPTEEKRYSPAQCTGCTKRKVIGKPDHDKICTSHVERQNLTVRMSMRRFTRLTNGFSKKWENLWAALCLHFAYYNFCRIHSTIRVTPAMESKLTDHVWTIRELLATQD